MMSQGDAASRIDSEFNLINDKKKRLSLKDKCHLLMIFFFKCHTLDQLKSVLIIDLKRKKLNIRLQML